MPKANWGISASDVDEFDRDDLYTPYQGPVPTNAVYRWRIRKLQFIAATEDSVPQLRVGLELDPRNRSEKKYKGYYQTAFIYISDKTKFRYIPFLDALGVSGRDFTSRTIISEDGAISKIGAWKNTGDFLISAQLQDNDPDFQHKNPKKIGWIGSAPDSDVDDEDESDDDEDIDSDVDEDDNDGDSWDDESEDDEEEDPKPRRTRASRVRAKRGAGRTTTTRRSRR